MAFICVPILYKKHSIKHIERREIMLLCCYHDDKNIEHFEQTQDIDTFTNNHPGITPDYIFSMDSEHKLSEIIRKQEFEKYAERYGFTENDYKAHLLTNNTTPEECELIGFLPQNTKYKCQVIRVSDGHRYKMTPEYVKKCIIRFKNTQIIGFD